MNRTSDRRAAVLVLALLLMGTIVGSTITLSTLISDTGHQSQSANNFISASLLSDTGLERSLAVVKLGRSTQTQCATASKISGAAGTGICAGTPAPSPALTPITSPGTTITLTANNPATNLLTWQQLLPRQLVNFDISNNGSALSGTANIINSIDFQKVDYDVSHPGQCGIDVSWVGLNNKGEVFFSGRAFLTPTSQAAYAVHPLFTNFNLLDPTLIRDTDGNLFGAGTVPTVGQVFAFRVRVAAIDFPDGSYGPSSATINTTIDTVSQLKISSTYGFPSRVDVKSTGIIGSTQTGAQSQKSASVLWTLPASGVFNYVLFTEGTINPG